MLQRQYKHMIHRMRQDLIAEQIRAQELQESYKSKFAIAEEECEKNRLAKQERQKAQDRLKDYLKHIDQDHFTRQKRVDSLQKSIRNKELALQRRIQRIKRQNSIAEKAANENKDSNELKMQENYLAQRFWSAFLKNKMEKEMKRTADIEKAFQTIRAATGLSDVQDIVNRFLTREQTYSQLLAQVADNEDKIDRLRSANEQWRNELHDLQIKNSGGTEIEKRSRAQNPDLYQLDLEIVQAEREKEKIEAINSKVQLVNEQVEAWCQRVSEKIDQQFNENITSY